MIWIYIAKRRSASFHHFSITFAIISALTSTITIPRIYLSLITSNHFASLVIILTHFAIIYAITLPSYPHQKSVRIEVTLPSLLNHLHHFAITFASTLRALLGQTKICVQGRIRQGGASLINTRARLEVLNL